MRLIVDACVAVKWVLNEERSPLAHNLLGNGELIAPMQLKLECRNTLIRKIAAGTILNEEIGPFIQKIESYLSFEEDDQDRAFALARSLGHQIYDCLYLAAAEKVGADAVITDDIQFYKRAMDFGPPVVLLERLSFAQDGSVMALPVATPSRRAP